MAAGKKTAKFVILMAMWLCVCPLRAQDWLDPAEAEQKTPPPISQIFVDVQQEQGALQRIWQMTGFTPAQLLLERPMQIQLAYFGALPHRELRYARIHYLLDLIDAQNIGSENPIYDWTRFDIGFDALIKNGLRPFFELMGDPGNFFAGFDTDEKIAAWQRLVRDTARHCIQRYGLQEVRQWYWETINEPDLAMWWPQRQLPTEANYCRYYDACWRGLKEADEQLVLGGPGNTGLTTSRYLRALLKHVDPDLHQGNAPGAKPAFISYHMKGGSGKGATPNAHRIVEGAIEMRQYIRQYHPALADIPLMNNECDPVVGWPSQSPWRAGPYYPAFMTRVIDLHRRLIIGARGIPFILLGNDNGFLGDWNQRTLCALFGDRRRWQEGFDFIKQPSLGMHQLLSYLGETQCQARTTAGGDGGYTNLGVMAALHKVGDQTRQVAVLVYNCADDPYTTGQTPVRLTINGLPDGVWRLAHYRIDDKHGNPHRLWQQFGGPAKPTRRQLAAMRRAEEPQLAEPIRDIPVKDGATVLQWDMPLPGLSLVLLNRDPQNAPPTPTGLRYEPYKGLDGARQAVLLWGGPESRFIQTFEVEYSPTADGRYSPISDSPFRSRAFLLTEPAAGYYRVKAVDFWDRASLPSEALGIDEK